MENNDYLKYGIEILYGNGELMMGEREGSPRQLKKEASQHWQRIFKPIAERKKAWSDEINNIKAAQAEPFTPRQPKKPAKSKKVKKASRKKTKK